MRGAMETTDSSPPLPTLYVAWKQSAGGSHAIATASHEGKSAVPEQHLPSSAAQPQPGFAKHAYSSERAVQAAQPRVAPAAAAAAEALGSKTVSYGFGPSMSTHCAVASCQPQLASAVHSPQWV
eukprot:5302407-Pleurochrysis_carterae.AAC.1